MTPLVADNPPTSPHLLVLTEDWERRRNKCLGSALVEGGLDCVAALPDGAVLRYRVNPFPPVAQWIPTTPPSLHPNPS